jgi:AcrR family transcriptional regulator
VNTRKRRYTSQTVSAKPQPERKRGRPPEGVREAIIETTLALIAERGVARLTTKEIAGQAGVSEASIYYHFADKPALIEAVILDGVLAPFQSFASGFSGRAVAVSMEAGLQEFTSALAVFWERILPLLSAVQSDAELRVSFQKRVNKLDLGPHRGVRLIAGFLSAQQEAGRVHADVVAEEAAMLICGACYLTGFQKHMLGPGAKRKLPSLRATVSQLAALFAAD